MMSKRNESVLSQLRSPRSAAIAGILFSLMSMVIMFHVHKFFTVIPADISQEWLKSHAKAASLSLVRSLTAIGKSASRGAQLAEHKKYELMR
jgi:hypothetical protein